MIVVQPLLNLDLPLRRTLCMDDRHAITSARGRDEVDAERIGIWASSYSGVHALVLGAIERRIGCVGLQVPLVSGHQNARRLIRADVLAPTQVMFVEARFRAAPPAMIWSWPRIRRRPARRPRATRGSDSSTPAACDAPASRIEVTLRSVEMLTEYEPGAYISGFRRRPLLVVVATV